MKNGLYAIIDPSHLSGAVSVEEMTRAVLRGGASIVQLRDTVSTSRQIFERACRLRAICNEFEIPFIVNNRLDIALAAGADGVHLGPDDLPVEAARRIAGDKFIIGGSAGTPEVARDLEKAGATYLGVGAIYDARHSKPDASAPRGPEAIEAAARQVDIPIFGIGGIHLENAPEVMAHGANGVAVIRALMQVDDPEEAARQLCSVLDTGSR